MPRQKRPKSLPGTSRKVAVGCGSLYVTITANNGAPLEVIATLGKAGGCAQAQNEALGRVISIGLQWGVPMEEYIETLSGIGCPSPVMFPKEERCLSCPDGFALALREYQNGEKGKI